MIVGFALIPGGLLFRHRYMKLSNFGLEGVHYKQTEHGPIRIMDGIELRKQGVLQADFGATVCKEPDT